MTRITPPQMPDIMLLSGETESSDLDYYEDGYQWFNGLTFFVPADIDGGSLALEVSPVPTGDEWYPLTSNGDPVSLGAGQATPVTFQAWARMRVVASTPQLATRTIKVNGRKQHFV